MGFWLATIVPNPRWYQITKNWGMWCQRPGVRHFAVSQSWAGENRPVGERRRAAARDV